jgi:hypothetical protein
MVVRLTDVIVPDVFLAYMAKDTMEKTALFQSGAITPDPMLASKLAGGGETFQIPFWKDLGNTEANIGNDNPATVATPLKIEATKQRARRQFRTQGWSDADLVKELAGSDPMQRIMERVAAYWNRQFQRTMIATLRGVIADNVANDSGDMVYDISAGSGTAAQVSADAVIEAAQTLGDASDQLKMIAMHSRVYANLAKQNLIDFIPNSEGHVRFPTYLGYPVVKDDSMPVIASGSDLLYHTYLMGPGVLGWAESPPDVPVETDRLPAQGNGAGVEQLWTRRQYVMHPYLFDFTESSVTGQFPTNAELQTAGNWNRVAPERKQVPLAVLVTKNG